jgi:hypothetical protein
MKTHLSKQKLTTVPKNCWDAVERLRLGQRFYVFALAKNDFATARLAIEELEESLGYMKQLTDEAERKGTAEIDEDEEES